MFALRYRERRLRVYALSALMGRENKNNRLWFKCNLKLGHLMYEVGDMGRLQRIIKELLRYEGSFDRLLSLCSRPWIVPRGPCSL